MAGRTKRSCRHPLRSPPPLLPYSVEKKKEFHSHSADALCRRRRRPLLKPNGRLQFFPFSTASKIEVQIKLPFTSEEERGRGKGRSIEGYRHFHKRADMYIYIYMRKHILLAALRSRYFSTPSSAFFFVLWYSAGEGAAHICSPLFSLLYTRAQSHCRCFRILRFAMEYRCCSCSSLELSSSPRRRSIRRGGAV